MKIRIRILFFCVWILSTLPSWSQCSICTKTASQLGEKPAAALNTAILYLMLAPLAIIAFIGWKWWKGNR